MYIITVNIKITRFLRRKVMSDILSLMKFMIQLVPPRTIPEGNTSYLLCYAAMQYIHEFFPAANSANWDSSLIPSALPVHDYIADLASSAFSEHYQPLYAALSSMSLADFLV